MSSPDFLVLHAYRAAVALALLPAGLHWWWTRSVFQDSALAVRPERHLAVTQRVSFVSMLCALAIVAIAGWGAAAILPLQFVALTATTYRTRRALFAETWPFHRYLAWRVRLHTAMFGLWWIVALGLALVATAGPGAMWWCAGLSVAIALAWHHWNGRVLLFMLGATRLERPDLESRFRRVFDLARVPTPALWRAGAAGGMLANAFALITLRQRGVLFLDTLLEQLTPDEITAILAHEVAHLEQFNSRKLLGIYLVTAVIIPLMMFGSAAGMLVVPGVETWVWVIPVAGVFGAIWLRARRMQAHESDADLRAIELCGDPEALIRGLTRIYQINHIPRRWSAQLEERATHPSLARRIRAIRGRISADRPQSDPVERLLVTSSEPGRCAVIDHQRVGFLWIDGDTADAETLIDRANRVERVPYDQLSELRLITKRGTIELIAVDRAAHRWSMPIRDEDAARVQAALDGVDHLLVAPAPARDFGIARRAAVVIVVLLAAPYNAIGAVLVPALLALRSPVRPVMLALAAALAGTAVASINELNVSIVRIAVLTILTLTVLWSVRRPQQDAQPGTHTWTLIERAGLLIPVGIGLIMAAASARDLFGLHSAVRDRAWFTASLAALAVFVFVQSSQRAARRVGLGVALLATAALVVGSPWFLLHAVADPLVAEMPAFEGTVMAVTALARRAIDGQFSGVRLTPDGNHFLLFESYDATIESDTDTEDTPHAQRFIAGGFDGWSREIRAFDVVTIDDQRLLVLDRHEGSSALRAEDLRTGQSLWTTTLPALDVASVQASPDGRWRVFARRGNRFERIDGQVGMSAVTSTKWTGPRDARTYMDMPRNDGGSVALGVAPVWEEPTLTWLLADWRETTQLLRVDSAKTTEIATSHLRVECPAPPMDVTGYVCLSFDGRSSRFWRVEPSSGTLVPIGDTREIIWNASQPSEQRLAGVANGRPLIAALDTRTLVSLIPDKYCWTQDVDVSRDIVVATCGDGRATTVTQYRLPASDH